MNQRPPGYEHMKECGKMSAIPRKNACFRDAKTTTRRREDGAKVVSISQRLTENQSQQLSTQQRDAQTSYTN